MRFCRRLLVIAAAELESLHIMRGMDCDAFTGGAKKIL
jgi:hypothetical protein